MGQTNGSDKWVRQIGRLRGVTLRPLTIHRGVEQLAARRAHNPEVGGSSPPPATIEEIQIGFPLFFMVAGGGVQGYALPAAQWG